MARNGVTGLLLKNEDGKSFCITKGPRRSTWIQNIHLHTNPITRSLYTKRESVHSFVARMSLSKHLKHYEVEAFYCNENIVKVKDMYPGSDKYFVAFYVDGKKFSLLTIGSKTANEFKIIGCDRFGKSRVPLILINRKDVEGKTHVESVNLDPFLS